MVRDAADQGASAEQIIEMLAQQDIPILDATLVALQNAPAEMAGDITEAAMERVATEQQEEIAYLAISSTSGVGSCKVAELLGMPRAAVCEELLQKAQESSPPGD
jgi:hypothetical protein